MITFLTEHNAFSPQQHGFTCQKSCFTNLLETFEDWTTSVDQGHNVDVFYFLDFRKAFDSVPHQRLLIILKGYGIGGNIYSFSVTTRSGCKLD